MRRCCIVSTVGVALLFAMRPHAIADPQAWSGTDALAAAAWATATVASAWLAAVTALTAIAARTRRRGVARVAIRITPGALRPVVETALAGVLVLAGVAPAHALRATTPTVTVDEPVVRAAPTVPATPPPAPRTAPLPAARTHQVRSGDNLWLIAREELRSRDATGVDDAAVARYWLAIIAANRATLRSGNPSLIFPGELVALPNPG